MNNLVPLKKVNLSGLRLRCTLVQTSVNQHLATRVQCNPDPKLPLDQVKPPTPLGVGDTLHQVK